MSAINNGVVDLAQYNYLGRATVAYTILPQPQAWNSLMESAFDKSYPYWDRFNRPTVSQWEKTYANGSTTATYDLNGNLTSEGSALDSYQYVYDAFNRLRQIKDKTGNVVQEHRYNGLGYRIGWHYDVSKSGGGGTDGTVDSNDPWYYFAYDERWRVAATYRGSDTYPKEQFYAHGAGLENGS